MVDRRSEAHIHYTMRVRITTSLHGSIDGIQLDRFVAGSVYDVSVSLACYLFATRAAEPVIDDSPPVVLPPTKQLFGSTLKGNLSKAADRSGGGNPDR